MTPRALFPSTLIGLTTLLLTSCISAPAETTPTPTASASTPSASEASSQRSRPSEAELREWVESMSEFDDDKDDAEDYLGSNGTEISWFFCGEIGDTNLPSEAFEEGLVEGFYPDPVFAMEEGGMTIKYRRGFFDQDWLDRFDTERRRIIQYRVATTVTCPWHQDAFEEWFDERD